MFGKLGYRDKQFTFVTLSDEHNLWHTPLESGRMPETANEIAAVRAVLDACYWIANATIKRLTELNIRNRTVIAVG